MQPIVISFPQSTLGMVEFAAEVSILAVERRQGIKISAIEEIAYRMGFIDLEPLEVVTGSYGKSAYDRYCRIRTAGRRFSKI